MKLKRTLTLILAAVLGLLCLSACKGKNKFPAPAATAEYAAAVMAASCPTRAATVTTYTLTDGTVLTGQSTLQVMAGDPMISKYAYEYEVLSGVGAEELTTVVRDAVYTKGSRVANFVAGGYNFESYTAETTLADLDLAAAAITEQQGGYVCTLKVASDLADAKFGTALGAVGDVTVTVTIRDGAVQTARVAYETARGSMVSETTYTYVAESFRIVDEG